MVRTLPLLLLGLLVARAQDFDLVIRHARIIDGTGAPARAGDVAVRDGRIAAVGSVTGTGRAEIDAQGRVVAPGFIDVHTHSEDITRYPLAENFTRMGVTTIITGNCGSSRRDIGAFFHELEQAKVAVNVGTLIGHGSIRAEAMGGSFDRRPTAAELARMQQLVQRGMDDGALGLSTGLIYLPGTFAKTDEIVALARIAAAGGGIYASHMRHENYRIREALQELITVAREAHIPAEVSHFKLSGPAAWGQAAELLNWLDRTRAEGLQITHDVYVYTASSTGIGSLIAAEFRSDNPAVFRQRLGDPAIKSRIVAEMKDSLRKGNRPDYSYAVVASFRPDPRLNGKTIPEAARLLRGADTLDDQIETVLEIEARGGGQGVFHGMNEADLETFLSHPLTMIGSDGGPRKFGDAMPHPRSYGNSARVLARYVRERHRLTLEEAVRKMTLLPVETFHLGDRGVIHAGAIADLVVFDPEKIDDPSRYDDPHHYAVGFSDVVVNGIPVIRDGQLTGACPGKPVRLSPATTAERREKKEGRRAKGEGTIGWGRDALVAVRTPAVRRLKTPGRGRPGSKVVGVVTDDGAVGRGIPAQRRGGARDVTAV